jgi:hypothetical protein
MMLLPYVYRTFTTPPDISSRTWRYPVGFRSSTRYCVVTPPTVLATRLPSPS